jgi:hypothetical protein
VSYVVLILYLELNDSTSKNSLNITHPTLRKNPLSQFLIKHRRAFFSSRQNMATSDHFDYEYMNENEIDEELKCVICKQPLQSPVSLSTCHHTFCKECIKTWLDRNHICPTCRHVTSHNHQQNSGLRRSFRTPSYVAINTRIVLNQLDRLLVRCLLCGEDQIQRCNYSNHEKCCSKKVVLCPSADIKCSWKGTRDELTIHLNTCSFQIVRPIIDDLKEELQSTQTVQAELKNSVEILEKKVTFLLKLINKGNLMTQECTMPMNECKYKSADTSDRNSRFTCSICHQRVRREQVLVHACLGDCICYSCVNNQYSNTCSRGFQRYMEDSEEWD